MALNVHMRQKAESDIDAFRAAGDTSCFPGFLAPALFRDLMDSVVRIPPSFVPALTAASCYIFSVYELKNNPTLRTDADRMPFCRELEKEGLGRALNRADGLTEADSLAQGIY